MVCIPFVELECYSPKSSTGCNELIFNPLIEWWRKGPINKQLHVFLWSAAPVHYKVSMTSYMFSYCEFSCNLAALLANSAHLI